MGRKRGKADMSLQMKPSDLGELYTLLTMYQNVYGGVEDRFLAEIADNYHRSTTCFVCDGGKDHTVFPITNPRGAGRKCRNDPDEADTIRRLRKSGRSIRSIASETGRSIGYVHKLIHEHSSCDVQQNITKMPVHN